MSCICRNCHSYWRHKDKTFHAIPKNDPYPWLEALRIPREDWQWLKNKKVCSRHFTNDCFDRTGQTVRLISGSRPTLNLPIKEEITDSPPVRDIEQVFVEEPIDPSLCSEPNPTTELEDANSMLIMVPTTLVIKEELEEDSPSPPVRDIEQVFVEEPIDASLSSEPNPTTELEDAKPMLILVPKTLVIKEELEEDSPGDLTPSLSANSISTPNISSFVSNSAEENQKLKRFIDAIHNYSCSPGKYKNKFVKSQKELILCRKRLSASKAYVRKLQEKIQSLKQVIKTLNKNKALMSESVPNQR